MIVSAILLGLLGSLHCLGMCGPIAFMLPVNRENPLKKAVQIFSYHFGRLLSYSLIGLLFGLVGKSLYIFGLQQKLSVFMGLIMILAVILPFVYKKRIPLSQPIYRLISKLKSNLGNALQKKSADTFLTIGFLNGFLPCGLVYMALLGAMAMGNAMQGSLFMALFGLGTVPLMTSAAYMGHLVKGSLKNRLVQIIPFFVVAVGILFILRGLGLGIPYISPAPMMDAISSQINCH